MFPRKYDKLLLALAEYAAFHGRTCDAPRLIYECDSEHKSCGGLGDRLRGIAYTLLLAMFNRRKLLLHWGTPNGEQIYLKPNLINWVPEKSDTGNVKVCSTGKMQVMFSCLNSPMNVAITTNLELETIRRSHPEWLTDGLKRTGLHLLTKAEMNEILGIVFRYLFQFRNDLLRIMNSAKHRLALDTQKYVSVHIRTGFVGTNYLERASSPKFIRKKDQWEKMLQCAVNVSNRIIGLNSSIFLATDSTLVKDLAANTYGVRYRTLDAVLTNVDNVNKKTGPNEAQKEGMLAVWVDFILLAQSYIQVRAGSNWIKASGFALGAGHLCVLPRNQSFNGLRDCTLELLTNDNHYGKLSSYMYTIPWRVHCIMERQSNQQGLKTFS